MEVCVDSLESVINAFEGGANRVELCSSLNEGGLTPSYGLYKSVRNYLDKNETDGKFGVHCMIRCRAGEFNYNEHEINTMIEDLNKFIELGVDGLVFGALDQNGNVDECLMKEFISLVPSSVKTTFHRAFDVCADWKKSFNQIENLGFNKLLTSGQKKSAYEGKELIRELVTLSKTVDIIAGAGVNISNLESILKETNCKEFHSSCRVLRDSKMLFRNTQVPMGSPSYDEFSINYTDKFKVKELVEIFKKF